MPQVHRCWQKTKRLLWSLCSCEEDLETKDLITYNTASSMFISVAPDAPNPTGTAQRGSGRSCAHRGFASQPRSPKLREGKPFTMGSKPVWPLPQREILSLLYWTVSKPVSAPDGDTVSVFQGGSLHKKGSQCLWLQDVQNVKHLWKTTLWCSQPLCKLRFTGLRDRIQTQLWFQRLGYFHYVMPLMSDHISPAQNSSFSFFFYQEINRKLLA